MKKLGIALLLLMALQAGAQTIITNVTLVDVEKQKLIPNATEIRFWLLIQKGLHRLLVRW